MESMPGLLKKRCNICNIKVREYHLKDLKRCKKCAIKYFSEFTPAEKAEKIKKGTW